MEKGEEMRTTAHLNLEGLSPPLFSLGLNFLTFSSNFPPALEQGRGWLGAACGPCLADSPRGQWASAFQITIDQNKIGITVIFLQGIRMGHEDGLRWVRIRLLPHPGLLCFNVQLAKLTMGKNKNKTTSHK